MPPTEGEDGRARKAWSQLGRGVARKGSSANARRSGGPDATGQGTRITIWAPTGKRRARPRLLMFQMLTLQACPSGWPPASRRRAGVNKVAATLRPGRARCPDFSWPLLSSPGARRAGSARCEPPCRASGLSTSSSLRLSQNTGQPVARSSRRSRSVQGPSGPVASLARNQDGGIAEKTSHRLPSAVVRALRLAGRVEAGQRQRLREIAVVRHFGAPVVRQHLHELEQPLLAIELLEQALVQRVVRMDAARARRGQQRHHACRRGGRPRGCRAAWRAAPASTRCRRGAASAARRRADRPGAHWGVGSDGGEHPEMIGPAHGVDRHAVVRRAR